MLNTLSLQCNSTVIAFLLAQQEADELESVEAAVENKPFTDQYGNTRSQERSADGRFGSGSAQAKLSEDTQSLAKSAGKVVGDVAEMGKAALTKQNADALAASLKDFSQNAGSLAKKAVKSMEDLTRVVMAPEDADKIITPMVESVSRMASQEVSKLVAAERGAASKAAKGLDKALKSGDLSQPIMKFFGDQSVEEILSAPREFTPKGIGGTIAAVTLLGTAIVAWTGEKILEEIADPVVTPKAEGGSDVAKQDIKTYGQAGQVIQKGLGQAAKAEGEFLQSQLKGMKIIGDRVAKNYLEPFLEEQIINAIKAFDESKVEAGSRSMPTTVSTSHAYLKKIGKQIDWTKLAELSEEALEERVDKILGKSLEAAVDMAYRQRVDNDGVTRATGWIPSKGRRGNVPVRDKPEENPKAKAESQKELQNAPPSFVNAMSLLATGSVLTGELIGKVASDPDVRKRLGLATGLVLGDTLDKLNQLTLKEPVLDKKIGEVLDSIGLNLAKEYGNDKDPFAQAMRVGELPTPPKDASLADRLSFYLTKAKILSHVVSNPEKYSEYKEKRDASLKKIGHAALGTLSLVAIAAGPDIAYPLLSQMEIPVLSSIMVRTEIELMSLAKSWFIGAKVDELAFEPLVEKLDIEDPRLNFLIRFGLSMSMTHVFYKYGIEHAIDHAGEALFKGIKNNAKLISAKLGKKDLELISELVKK